ncbi:MAG: hypothetical protein RL544_998 [Bacteroidota bacterium]|jgi:uncharacterized protein (DUF1800 family)
MKPNPTSQTYKRIIRYAYVVGFLVLMAFAQPAPKMPYKKAGLTEQEAALHLLNRFTFGPKPGQVEELVQQGLENWFMAQLQGAPDNEAVRVRLAGYPALSMPTDSIVNTYLQPAQLLRLAIAKGYIDKDSVDKSDKPAYREALKKMQADYGFRPIQELQRELINQKVIRAVYSDAQLQEVLTDFWFNHFNVSLTKNQIQQLVLPYERDAIRPNVLNNFSSLLFATAKHPAMLLYLDNALSISNENEYAKRQLKAAQRLLDLNAAKKILAAASVSEDSMQKMDAMENQITTQIKRRKSQGLNENYAREVMELHTLGVNGGYTQSDVTELARALTGWGVKPMYEEGPLAKRFSNATPDQLLRRGLQVEDCFLFSADKHDQNIKTILGKTFPANGGYNEGMEALSMLASHPATARFIATKLATKFIADEPPTAVIEEMTKTFIASKGDIKEVLLTMVMHPGFWAKAKEKEKIKSPFELAVSAVRATGTEVVAPYQVFTWSEKMGQKFYFYQAPTGFPDRASYWINTGSLLNRMNFGMAIAAQKIPGFKTNLLQLNQNHEPESVEEALQIYTKLLLPVANQKENSERIMSIVRAQNIDQKIASATNDNSGKQDMQNGAMAQQDNTPLKTMAQVVGVIIGSPAFQRK